MKSKPVAKVSHKSAKVAAISGTTIGIFVGSLLAGAGLATAVWWYSDRLDLSNSLGKTASINELTQTGDCKVGDQGTNTFKQAGATFVQPMECVTVLQALPPANLNGKNITQFVENTPIRIKEVRKDSGVSYEYQYDTKFSVNGARGTVTSVEAKSEPITFQANTFWKIGDAVQVGGDLKHQLPRTTTDLKMPSTPPLNAKSSSEAVTNLQQTKDNLTNDVKNLVSTVKETPSTIVKIGNMATQVARLVFRVK